MSLAKKEDPNRKKFVILVYDTDKLNYGNLNIQFC